MNPPRRTSAFHTRRRIYRVSEQTVTRHCESNNPRTARPRVQSYSQSQRRLWQMPDTKPSALMQQVQCHCGDLFSVVMNRRRQPPNHHVRIPNCFNFVHIIRVDRRVETGVEVVEQVDNLKWRRMRRDCREADDVAEVDRYLRELLGVHVHPQLQFLGHRTAKRVQVCKIMIQTLCAYLRVERVPKQSCFYLENTKTNFPAAPVHKT